MPFQQKPRFALLIGIDHYLRPKNDPCTSFRDLRGCCPDILSLHQHLLQTLHMPPEAIQLLLSPQEGTAHTTKLPTYDAIVSGIRWLKAAATPGAELILAYSGHGGRDLTAWPELKGKNAVDEGLIPADYLLTKTLLRDLELAALLQDLLEVPPNSPPIQLILLFDACHSGGATRDIQTDCSYHAAREVALRTPELQAIAPSQTAPALKPPPEAIHAAVKKLEALSTAPDKSLAPWPGLPHMLQLAACGAAELANEQAIRAGDVPRGFFSYCLQEALPAAIGTLSWRQLLEKTRARVVGRYPGQNPLLVGDPLLATQEVFGSGFVLDDFPLRVLKVETHPRTGQTDVTFQGGPGLELGASVALFDFPQAHARELDRLGTAMVRQSSLGRVIARVHTLKPDSTLTPGMPAALEQAAPATLQPIWLDLPATPTAATPTADTPTADTPAADTLSWLNPALTDALDALGNAGPLGRGGAFVRRAQSLGEASFRIAPSWALGPENPTLALLDGRGNGLPNLPSPILLENPEAMQVAVRALNAIARYQSLLTWQAPSTGLPDSPWLQIRCVVLPRDYRRVRSELPRAEAGREVSPLDGPIFLTSGEFLTFRFVNKQERPEQRIYLYAFCFSNNYAIIRWPLKLQELSDPSIPGGFGCAWLAEVPFKAEPQLDHDVSYLKIFASTVDPGLAWLEQPSLAELCQSGASEQTRGLDFGDESPPFSQYVARIALRMKG